MDITPLLFIYRFVGGELNACYNAVDRHVENGKGSKVALIHDSPVTKVIRKVTYSELQHQVLISFYQLLFHYCKSYLLTFTIYFSLKRFYGN